MAPHLRMKHRFLLSTATRATPSSDIGRVHVTESVPSFTLLERIR